MNSPSGLIPESKSVIASVKNIDTYQVVVAKINFA